MGLKVDDNFKDVKEYSLVSYNFNHGNEYILHFMNEHGDTKRKRISSDMKYLFEEFAYINQFGEVA